MNKSMGKSRGTSVLAWILSAVLVASCLPACSSDDNTGGTSGRALSAPEAVGASGLTMRSKAGSDTLEITRIKPSGKKPADLEADTWTVFLYLCGSDLESEDAAATDDLAELVGASGSDQVRFVVQTGGAESWSYDELEGDKTQRLLIQDGAIMEVGRLDAKDMGDGNTLAEFLTWGVENYPAEHMGVILWDHGGGSLSGVCFDERNDDDSLVLREIDAAMASVFEHMWDKFDFVGFDACLMSTLETANVLASYADYQYASEEIEPSTGWEYSTIMEYLAKHPNASGEDLGKVIADSYLESIETDEERDMATFAVTNLAHVDNLLQAFHRFSKELLESTADDQTLANVARAITEVDNFGGNNHVEGFTNMVDLAGLAQAASDKAPSAKDVLAAQDKAVVYHREGSTHEQARGLSLYYPLAITDSRDLTLFEQVCVSPYYLSFVDRQAQSATYGEAAYDEDTWFGAGGLWTWLFMDEETGEEGTSAQSDNYWSYVDEHTDQSSYITFADEPQIDEDGIYWFRLDKHGLENTSAVTALLYMVSDDEKDLICLGETYDVNGDWKTGEFFDQFDGYWLSLPDGQDLCTYIADSGDDYTVFTCPIELNGEETNLRVRVYDDYKVVVEGAWDGISDAGESGRGITKIKKGDRIVPLYDAYAIDEDEESQYVGQEYKVGKDFDVLYDYLDEGTYLYSFTIYDVYGDYLVTDGAFFGVDDKGETSFLEA